MHESMHSLSNKVDSLIFANPRLTLDEIAHSVGADRHKIERAIRELHGFGFRDLKKRARLKRAVTLLKEERSGYSIKEIAAEVGLTPNHLSRFIRSMTGLCATELLRHKS